MTKRISRIVASTDSIILQKRIVQLTSFVLKLRGNSFSTRMLLKLPLSTRTCNGLMAHSSNSSSPFRLKLLMWWESLLLNHTWSPIKTTMEINGRPSKISSPSISTRLQHYRWFRPTWICNRWRIALQRKVIWKIMSNLRLRESMKWGRKRSRLWMWRLIMTISKPHPWMPCPFGNSKILNQKSQQIDIDKILERETRWQIIKARFKSLNHRLLQTLNLTISEMIFSLNVLTEVKIWLEWL
jgi:hypothetical protein